MNRSSKKWIHMGKFSGNGPAFESGLIFKGVSSWRQGTPLRDASRLATVYRTLLWHDRFKALPCTSPSVVRLTHAPQHWQLL